MYAPQESVRIKFWSTENQETLQDSQPYDIFIVAFFICIYVVFIYSSFIIHIIHIFKYSNVFGIQIDKKKDLLKTFLCFNTYENYNHA